MKADWCNIGVYMPWRGQEHFTSLLTWLSKNIDDRDWDWDIAHDSGLHHRIYYFAHERDAVMFKLAWS